MTIYNNMTVVTHALRHRYIPISTAFLDMFFKLILHLCSVTVIQDIFVYNNVYKLKHSIASSIVDLFWLNIYDQ